MCPPATLGAISEIYRFPTIWQGSVIDLRAECTGEKIDIEARKCSRKSKGIAIVFPCNQVDCVDLLKLELYLVTFKLY